jgi:hypothetical protein
MFVLGPHSLPAYMIDRRETKELQAQWQAAEALERCMWAWAKPLPAPAVVERTCSN